MCEEVLKWGSLGMELEKEGFPVMEICITCPKNSVTYKMKRLQSEKQNAGVR